MNTGATSQIAPFRTILMGTDLSSPARNALDWAIEIARAHRAKLEMMHVQSKAKGAASLSDEQRIASVLDDLEMAARDAGVNARSRTETGRPWKRLASYAKDDSADLIVVGSHGHTVALPLLLGSTTDRLVRMTSVPVLAVHPGDARHEPGVVCVLAATDFSAEAASAVIAAARLIKGFGPGGRLLLLHVEATPPFYESSPPASAAAHEVPDITADAIERLDSIAAPIRAAEIDVGTIVRVGYAPTVIAEEAHTHDADLIAVGARGRSALATLLIGSVAERVLHHAPCPVLMAPG